MVRGSHGQVSSGLKQYNLMEMNISYSFYRQLRAIVNPYFTNEYILYTGSSERSAGLCAVFAPVGQ